MKKVILGAAMLLAGLLSAAVLLAGAMSNSWTVNGDLSAFWNLSQYGLTPWFCLFVGVAAVGLCLALWGVWERKD